MADRGPIASGWAILGDHRLCPYWDSEGVVSGDGPRVMGGDRHVIAVEHLLAEEDRCRFHQAERLALPVPWGRNPLGWRQGLSGRDRVPCTRGDGLGRLSRGAPRREPGPDIVRSPLLLMVLMGRYLDEVHRRRFLAIHRLRHEQTLDEYRQVARTLGDDEANLAKVVQFGIFHEEGFLRWFDWMDDQAGPPADGVALR